MSTPAQTQMQAAPDGSEGRDETPDERADRNWKDILQEFRVSQTGTQVIAGFLLSVAFQQRFATLDAYQLVMYLTLVTLAALATAVGLASVGLHRGLFRRHRKEITVTIGDRLLRVMLLLVSILTAGVTDLIFDVVLSRAAGVIAGAAVLVVMLLLLIVVPALARRSEPKRAGR